MFGVVHVACVGLLVVALVLGLVVGASPVANVAVLLVLDKL